jgi:hypothetical protein
VLYFLVGGGWLVAMENTIYWFDVREKYCWMAADFVK